MPSGATLQEGEGSETFGVTTLVSLCSLQLQHGCRPRRKSRRCEILPSQPLLTNSRRFKRHRCCALVRGALVVAAAGMPGTASRHTTEGSIALAPICLSANGVVKGTRWHGRSARGSWQRWLAERMKKRSDNNINKNVQSSYLKRESGITGIAAVICVSQILRLDMPDKLASLFLLDSVSRLKFLL